MDDIGSILTPPRVFYPVEQRIKVPLLERRAKYDGPTISTITILQCCTPWSGALCLNPRTNIRCAGSAGKRTEVDFQCRRRELLESLYDREELKDGQTKGR